MIMSAKRNHAGGAACLPCGPETCCVAAWPTPPGNLPLRAGRGTVRWNRPDVESPAPRRGLPATMAVIAYTAVMKFPGENYLVYAQDPVRADVAAYADSGISRFLVSADITPDRLAGDMRQVRDVFAERGLDYEVVFAARNPGTRVTVTGGEVHVEQVPVWTIGGSLADLEQMTKDHELVYVHNTVHLNDVHWLFDLRELYEFMLTHPQARIVVFGHLNRSLFYGWGAAGSAIRIRSRQRRQIDRILDAKGGFWEVRRLADAHRVTGLELDDTSSSGMARAMMTFIQQIPLAFKEGYENFVRPENEERPASTPKNKSKQHEFLFSVSESRIQFIAGDRRLCDYCSVQYACKLYKERSVCIMPGTDGKRFADYFATRDADEVINGVAAALQMQATRLERILEEEYQAAENVQEGDPPLPRDPEINKMLNDVQRNATSYAKLLNPMLTRPQVAVQVNTNSGEVETLRQSEITPRMRASAARELEAAGTPRESLTPEMVLEHIAQSQGKVVEGEVVDGVRNDF